ncbi:unnamed protein product [Rangifer tarandus platyrhynchus]|uniref:Uncharacterized protein n=1 Tax=Rangifer tarandus platyrhynchus TaxID=3082113 RepID=A0ABN8ZAI9_RANTA|nr:unnamed protein product [Rangifer tarandus platyrhynchus]CAI9688415.1 unnamed protein product [Rangifer tarandus platyrhynchus]
MHRKDVRSSQWGQLALTRGEGCGVPGPLPLQACGGLRSPQALAPSSPTWGRGGNRPHRSRPRGGGWWPDGLVAPACSPRRTAAARPFRVRRGGRNRVRSRFPGGTGKVPEAPQRSSLPRRLPRRPRLGTSGGPGRGRPPRGSTGTKTLSAGTHSLVRKNNVVHLNG